MTRKRTSDSEFAVSSAKSAAPARRKTAATSRTRTKSPAATVETTPETAIAQPPVVQAVELVTVYEPTHEEISALAYSFWEARGYQGGSPEEDWLRAQEQLRARAFAASA